MARDEFLKRCDTFRETLKSYAWYQRRSLERQANAPIRIAEWAKTSKYFSEDIGTEMLKLAAAPAFDKLDMLELILAIGDSCEENYITRTLPCINVGGCGDGLSPIALSRSRNLIIVDPAARKHETDALEFDYGRGKENLTFECVPRRIEKYIPSSQVGSIISSNLDIDAIPHAVEFARKFLKAGGFLLRSPSAHTVHTLGATCEPGSYNSGKDPFFIDAETAKAYDLEKGSSYGVNCEFYRKV